MKRKIVPLLFLLFLLLPAAQAAIQVVPGDADREAEQILRGELSATTREEIVLVVGGPCANDLWMQYSEFSCDGWPYEEGEGVILIKDGGRVILIAGTTREDTQDLAQRFVQANAFAGAIMEESSLEEDVTVVDGGETEATVGTTTVRIEDVEIEDGVIERMTVNGDVLLRLSEGESVLTEDDVVIRVTETGTREARLTIRIFDREFEEEDEDEDEENNGLVTVAEGDDEIVVTNDAIVQIEDLAIAGSEIVRVTINGEEFEDLEVGDVRIVGEIEVEIIEIGETEATFLIRQSFGDDDDLTEGDTFSIDEGDDRTIEIEGETVDFEDISLLDGTIEEMRIDGDLHEDLDEDDTITVGGITLTVFSITENSVTFRVE